MVVLKGKLLSLAGMAGARVGIRKALHPIAHGVAVAVPVAHHHRQPSRHRLHRCQTEGFLGIVDQGKKQIRRSPTATHNLRVLAIKEVHRHVRGMALGRLLVAAVVTLTTGEPARHHEMEAPSTALCRFLKGDEHALGVGLLKKRQPPQPEHEHVLLRQDADGDAGNHGSADRLAARAEPPGQRPAAAGATGAAARGFHRNAG